MGHAQQAGSLEYKDALMGGYVDFVTPFDNHGKCYKSTVQEAFVDRIFVKSIIHFDAQ